jgi:DNA-binding NarL/FixJ family response regulator
MSLPPSDWEKINDCLLRLYRELDVQKHARRMLEILNELVPADSIALNYFKPPLDLTVTSIPEKFVTQNQINLVAKYGYESPYGTYYVATQDASWKMTTDFMPIEEFHKTELHRHALKPIGINYQIGGILAVLGDTSHVITVHRTHENFTEREREILNTLHPHLVTSYVNALACTQARESVAQIKAVVEIAPGAYGYFYRDGKLAWLQSKAEAWLAEFFGNEAKTAEKIPQSVNRLVVDSFGSAHAPRQLERVMGEELLTVCLGGSPLGGVILRLERKPVQPLPRFRPLPQLSSRENETLQWMTEGKRNSEIAAILGISERTVEKHVAEVLTHLQAENRATAIIKAMEYCATAHHGAPNGRESATG